MQPQETESVVPTKPEQEPVLIYDPLTGRWAEVNASFTVWMDDAIFRAYVASWYEWSA